MLYLFSEKVPYYKFNICNKNIIEMKKFCENVVMMPFNTYRSRGI